MMNEPINLEEPLSYENFADLTREHAVMRNFLLNERTRPSRSAGWPIFVRLLGEIHHHKEENFLFPIMFGSPRLEVGGPKCMTFFTPRVLGGAGWEDAFGRLQKLVGGGVEFGPSERTAFRDRVLEANSMLKIPLQDHVVGARALEQLKAERDPERLELLFSAFAGLMFDHIQREDECLLEMFRRATTAEQKAAYAQQAHEFDLSHGTAELLRGLAGRP